MGSEGGAGGEGSGAGAAELLGAGGEGAGTGSAELLGDGAGGAGASELLGEGAGGAGASEPLGEGAGGAGTSELLGTGEGAGPLLAGALDAGGAGTSALELGAGAAEEETAGGGGGGGVPVPGRAGMRTCPLRSRMAGMKSAGNILALAGPSCTGLFPGSLGSMPVTTSSTWLGILHLGSLTKVKTPLSAQHWGSP